MPVSEISVQKRLSVTLDPELVLERLILRRLSELQGKRGQDWLRSLLAQGFLTEGRWLRGGEPEGSKGVAPHESAIPTTPFARWLERAHTANRTRRGPRPRSAEARIVIPDASAGAKPFAHLRKVIG